MIWTVSLGISSCRLLCCLTLIQKNIFIIPYIMIFNTRKRIEVNTLLLAAQSDRNSSGKCSKVSSADLSL